MATLESHNAALISNLERESTVSNIYYCGSIGVSLDFGAYKNSVLIKWYAHLP